MVMRFRVSQKMAIGVLLLAIAVPAQQTPVMPNLESPRVVENAWPNPSGEKNTLGASTIGLDARSVLVSHQRSDGWRGTSSFQLSFTPGSARGAALVFGEGKGAGVAVNPGQLCFFRAAAKVVEGSAKTELELRARWLDADGNFL